MNYVSPIIDRVNAICGAIVALLSFVLGEHWILFAAYLITNVLDSVTRWMAAYLTHTESSNKCMIGIIKKIGYWIMIALAFGMSVIFIEIGEAIGVNLAVSEYIGWFVLCTLLINELRSIMENLVDAGYKLPVALTKGLEVANKVIEEVSDVVDDTEKENNDS